jgi:ABC-type branched-subunit amino acid transport system substrate-binding protein
MGARACASLALAICVAAMILASVTVSGEAEGWAGPQVPPAPGFQVKVALVLPLSGDVQSYGESARDGALLAIQEAQAAGWDIQTVLADSECDGAAAADAANQVIFTDTVRTIVGAVCSSASIPISEIAEANHVLQISPSSTDPHVTRYADGTNKEYVFRACFLDPFQGQSTHFWAGDPRQVVVDFVQAYSATYGTQPDTLAALGYDATSLLLQAIAQAGVDDPSVVKDAMAGIVYEGVTGKIAFDEFGDPIK